MAQLKISQTDVGYVLENNFGSLELSWEDFNSIEKYGNFRDALDEIGEYLANYDDESCLKLFGMKCDEITGNNEFLGKIVDRLIKNRIEKETTDDVHDAIKDECSQHK